MIRTYIPEKHGPEIEPPDGAPGLLALLALLGATVASAVIFYLAARYSGLSVTIR